MKGFRAARMLYRKGTQDRIHGIHVDTIVVDEHEVEEHLAQGWHGSPDDVKAFEAERSRHENAQRSELDRARDEGARQAREQEERRAFDEALQRAREEGAREERERIAAEAAKKGEKKGGNDKQQSVS